MKTLPDRDLQTTTGRGPAPAAADRLARALGLAAEADRIQARLVDATIDLLVTGDAEQATGLPLDLFLSAQGRMTRSDRRMLQAAAETLCQLPNVRSLFDEKRLSWSQVRAIVCGSLKHKLSGSAWDEADQMVAALVDDCAACEPDELVRRFDRWLWERLDARDVAAAEEAATASRYLALQPELDGTAGRFWGRTDAVGLALLDAATSPRPEQLGDQDAASLTPTGRVGRARHDNLMAQFSGRARGAASRPVSESWPGLVATEPGTRGSRTVQPPMLLATATVADLLGADGTTTELLVTLSGGRLRVSTETARRLLAGGFDTRLVVLDDVGQVVGVGHKTRVPPDWLRDALIVRDDVCTRPGCGRAGICCQADHARPWQPSSRDAPGPTDVDNLALVCGPHNRSKESDGWRVTGHPDGTRTWHHPRAGLTIRTLPHARPLPDVRAGPAPPRPG